MDKNKVFVWSAGDKKASWIKKQMFDDWLMFFVIFGLFSALLMGINTSLADNSHVLPVRILNGIIVVIMLGLCFGQVHYTKRCYKAIKRNKQIPLYVYTMRQFATIGKIPEDQDILFADKNGVVLALKEYWAESLYFSRYMHSFYSYKFYKQSCK